MYIYLKAYIYKKWIYVVVQNMHNDVRYMHVIVGNKSIRLSVLSNE